MTSEPRGKSTSDIEVTHISPHGIWLLIEEQEYFLPFEHFPWFRDATVGMIHHVEVVGPDHLYWPDLDVDLSLESIEHPERFPLVSKGPRTTG